MLLLNLGTPDSPDVADVRRYLREFLADPWVIRLPRRLRALNRPLARLIARVRGPRSAAAYRSIWTPEGSPLDVITRRQVAGLAKRLPRSWRVYHAMRYGNPSLRSVVERIGSDGITDLVIVPMYPQWSGPTVGTALEALYAELRRTGLRLNLSVRAEWYDDAGYVDAQAHLVHATARANGLDPSNAVLLFSAHSLPQSYVDAGDPYEGHVRRTIELVRERLGWPAERMRIGFQSKLGPVPWLGPSTEEVLTSLAREGEENVLVVPVSFTVDCLETLAEIDQEYAQHLAREAPGARLVRVPANNDDPAFLDALLGLVRRGAHRIAPGTRPVPLFDDSQRDAASAPLSASIARLAVVGVATARRLESPCALQMEPVSEETFKRVKRPQIEAAELVSRASERPDVDEAWLYNTCQRYELYVLVREGASAAEIARELALELGGAHSAEVHLRTGADAYWHLLRTAAGLNSRLPGDTDVLEQLAAARRMGQAAGAAGAGAARVIGAATEAVRALRAETAWGAYSLDYCRAALGPLLAGGEDESRAVPLTFERARFVVIGGSTTTVSLVGWLSGEHDLADERLTVVYRGATRKRLGKVLARLVKGATRLVVDEYDDPGVLDSIAKADVLFLGIDRERAVLRRGHLEGLRDFSERPLTVIDFNTHGSTEGCDGIPGVCLVTAAELAASVDRHAERLERDPAFEAARRAAEERLRIAADEHACEAAAEPKAPLPLRRRPRGSTADPANAVSAKELQR